MVFLRRQKVGRYLSTEVRVKFTWGWVCGSHCLLKALADTAYNQLHATRSLLPTSQSRRQPFHYGTNPLQLPPAAHTS